MHAKSMDAKRSREKYAEAKTDNLPICQLQRVGDDFSLYFHRYGTTGVSELSAALSTVQAFRTARAHFFRNQPWSW